MRMAMGRSRFKAPRHQGPLCFVRGHHGDPKNHETLYRAYLRMLERDEDIPQMVFAGHPGWKTGRLSHHPRQRRAGKGKILWITPHGEELSILYENCEFTILASLYEGWSLSPCQRASGTGNSACAVTPLPSRRRRGAFRIHPGMGRKTWSERICYHSHPQALADREKAIAEHWHPPSTGKSVRGMYCPNWRRCCIMSKANRLQSPWIPAFLRGCAFSLLSFCVFTILMRSMTCRYPAGQKSCGF